MTRKFLQLRKERFKTWWVKPATRLERLGSQELELKAVDTHTGLTIILPGNQAYAAR